MEMKERSFAARRIEYDGALYGAGVVIQANGELRQPDFVIPNHLFNSLVKSECTEIWEEIAADEVAVSWEWRYGHYDFQTAIRPDIATSEQLAKAKQLQSEIRSLYAAEINWADDEIWLRNPLSEPGWSLKDSTVYSSEELREMVEAVNRQASALPDPFGERPCGFLSQKDGVWYLQIGNSHRTYGEAVIINRSDVDYLRQLVRDYTCHAMVVQKRQLQREEFVPQYEEYRSVIESKNGQLIDVGVDGFCVIMEGIAELYDLHEGDSELFAKFCESLK